MAKRRPHFESLESRLCLASGITLQTTFSLPTGSWSPTVYRASPIFVDIFGTGKDDLIAVASGAELVAYAENANGSASAVVTYKVPGGVADIKGTPIVVTDPSTGRRDLFAAMGRNDTGTVLEDGRVFGWDLQTGNLLSGWSQGVSTGSDPLGQSGVYGALTSGVLQGNGMPDLVVTSFSHEVTAITLSGTILWQWNNDDTIESGAVIADIGRDGTPEVVVGGDSSASPYFQQGGWVNVISNTGQLVWRKQILGEVTWSSPVVADLLGNGQLDIVIGTGDNFSALDGAASTEAGDYIYAFDPQGNMLPGWPYQTTTAGNTAGHEVLAAPAVADMLGNGQLDVIAIDRAGYLHVVQPNGQDLPGFVGGKLIAPDLNASQIPDDYASPVVADVTGGGKPDIIATASDEVNAFDSSGNLISIGHSPLDPSGNVENFDIAPAIGNFDGTGEDTMAVISDDPYIQSRPDQVQIYQLPQTTLAPPWPFLRRTLTGDAVMRSPVYDQKYVVQAFTTLMGSQPASGTIQLYVNALNADATNLLSTAQLIASSLPVQDAEVARVYEGFLGHAPDAYALSYWSTYLDANTYRQMESQVASSTEFAQRAGSFSQEIVQLYQAILFRSPSQAEINNWVASKLPIASIATDILNSSESITDQFDTIVQAMYGQGTQSLIPVDDEAAFSLDYHSGVGEEQSTSLMLASNASYASTNYAAGYVENVYRDVLGRTASASEDASWLAQFDAGTVGLGQLASLILNSTEARQDYVNAEYIGLLGRSADSGALASLSGYTRRENVVITIVGSTEYYTRNGGTNASFVTAAFRDLAGIGISQATLNSFVAEMAKGYSTAQVANQIIYTGSLYFDDIVISQLMYYIPNETQGVLRTGELPANAAGQPINPDPNLINYFLAMYESGESDEQVIATMLVTPQYAATVSYYRGLYRSPGVRN